ncbi:MAG: hypothetical protein JJU12_03045 [Chlamydiales bacterium]|nr:hypothetical protein [Chlamydiales bacterium]
MTLRFTNVPGYYTSGGNLFVDGTDESLQNEARQATAVVLSMIKQNDRAFREVENWAKKSTQATAETAYVLTAVTLDTLTDPWFWLSVHVATRPVYFGPAPLGPSGGCCGPSDCSGGGCDEDSCKAALLIMAIAILVAAFAASVGLTVKHGMDADEARRKADEIKQLYRESQDQRVKTIYSKIAWEQNKEYASQFLKTAFSAAGAAGVGFLTLSSIFALCAVLNGVAVSPYATTFALAGAAAVGGSLVGHTVRGVALLGSEQRDLEFLHDLFNDIMSLEAPHPFRILAEGNEINATMNVGEYRYIKEKENFRREKIEDDTDSIYADYVNFIVSDKQENSVSFS